MSKLPISLRPAAEADHAAITDIHYTALDEFHAFYAAFFATHPRELTSKANAKFLKEPTHTFTLAIDGASGAPVGFIRYLVVRPADKKEETKSDEPSPYARKPHMEDLWSRLDERSAPMDKCYEDAHKRKPHVFVWHLMVKPEYQGRGVGKALLQKATDFADEQDLPAFIVSSTASRPLYLKMGFDILDTFVIDNEYWAGEIVKLEQGLGMAGNEELIERYKGVKEVESWMMRLPQTRADS